MTDAGGIEEPCDPPQTMLTTPILREIAELAATARTSLFITII
jgi:hypothetical protein